LNYRGRAFRAHDPRWSFQPTSGRGAAISGGRFNVRGQEALYLALDPVTALAECTQGFAARMLPLTLCEYDVDCADIIDLTDEATRAEAGVAWADMACGWLTHQRAGKIAPSQAVASKLVKQGHAGAIVPSFVPGVEARAANLVLWKWGADLPYRVMVYDPDGRLEKFSAL
jgi:RES domain-containing protein